MKVSRDFIIAVKLDSRPAYTIAQLAKVNSNWLSKIVIGAAETDLSDLRIRRIAVVLGIKPEQVFENAD